MKKPKPTFATIFSKALANRWIFLGLVIITFSSCSIQKKISRSAQQVISDSALLTAHVGISIYEPATGKYWYNYNGDKFFVPASNTKIPTCYAAMKYLGDSLKGLKYGIPEEQGYKNRIVIQPTGDPTFLHNDYKQQPVFDFLQKKVKEEESILAFMDTIWRDEAWGSGWGWSDYLEPYMAERNSFPIYGNTITIALNDVNDRNITDDYYEKNIRLFKTGNSYFDSLINETVQTRNRRSLRDTIQYRTITRNLEGNQFFIKTSKRPFTTTTMSFVTSGSYTTRALLQHFLNNEFHYVSPTEKRDLYSYDCPECDIGRVTIKKWHTIYSQPTDSLLKPMMHRSDNFFAEQSLLMVSNQQLGIMNDEQIIDTLLKTDFRDLPQKPRWVDGSGLSRYNLFTPQDFIGILNKMQREFGMDRIKHIFPTGGEGTLANYYKTEAGNIYAKTGTLSGVVSLSGYLYTNKNKLLLFSILVNNHQGSATAVRKAVEKFVSQLRTKW